jgi:hypothetical protein
MLLFGDGSIRFLNENIAATVVIGLVTRSGSEVTSAN